MAKRRRSKPDSISQIVSLISLIFGIAALVLTCVGLGTPEWYIRYGSGYNISSYRISSANFFYSCNYYIDNTLDRCVQRQESMFYYPNFAQIEWINAYQNVAEHAGALCIVGIIFLSFGILFTVIMTVVHCPSPFYCFPPGVFFLACLFMAVGLAEGSFILIYNGYSAILFQTGQVATILALCLSTFAAGRNHFASCTDAGINTAPKKSAVSVT
ncbi:unnamed protein product [Adineta ricciae]|uniref:Uncharacterized protein n=1 Tax=Adineta ricciae TaxID=249248 RepID=A0A814LW32_ADIRI|nr:unnamed protein product [Adineta ricciae]CAF1071648.1 unnamed protein product [Adineta ricciae]